MSTGSSGSASSNILGSSLENYCILATLFQKREYFNKYYIRSCPLESPDALDLELGAAAAGPARNIAPIRITAKGMHLEFCIKVSANRKFTAEITL